MMLHPSGSPRNSEPNHAGWLTLTHSRLHRKGLLKQSLGRESTLHEGRHHGWCAFLFCSGAVPFCSPLPCV
jgi:hypothetical protein